MKYRSMGIVLILVLVTASLCTCSPSGKTTPSAAFLSVRPQITVLSTEVEVTKTFPSVSPPVITSGSHVPVATTPQAGQGTIVAPAPIPPPLNKEVQFELYTGDLDLLVTSCLTPPATSRHLIVVDVAVGYTNLRTLYAVSGELTESKWHLAEYDALVQTCLRQDVAGRDDIVYMLPEKTLRRYTDERYSHYLYFQTITYPDEVQEIHELYLYYLLNPKSYWDIYDPTDTSIITGTSIPTRINSIYRSYPCQRAMAEADHRLFKLLDEEGIFPFCR